jgi:signal transduction histidine kinase
MGCLPTSPCCHRIVAGRHGGEIKVRSVPGETWFEVRLPLREPVAAVS